MRAFEVEGSIREGAIGAWRPITCTTRLALERFQQKFLSQSGAQHPFQFLAQCGAEASVAAAGPEQALHWSTTGYWNVI